MQLAIILVGRVVESIHCFLEQRGLCFFLNCFCAAVEYVAPLGYVLSADGVVYQPNDLFQTAVRYMSFKQSVKWIEKVTWKVLLYFIEIETQASDELLPELGLMDVCVIERFACFDRKQVFSYSSQIVH